MPDVAEVQAGALIALLDDHRFSVTHEDELQAGIAEVLTGAEVPFAREVQLSRRDRIDFLTGAGVGIEVKVDGTLPTLLRQLQRYAQHDRVRALLVATNRTRLLALPASLSGKPVLSARLLAGGL